MKIVSSGEFRKTYAKLTEGVIVTVNGHPIGVWTPRSVSPDGVAVWPSEMMVSEYARTAGPRLTSQAERDAILRKLNKG